MLIVPLQAVPTQSTNIVLNGQSCVINVNARTTGPLTSIYVDLYVNGRLIEGGMIGLQGVRMVRSLYLGFLGDLIFLDTQPNPTTGPADPEWSGLGARWLMLFLFPAELNPVSV